MTKSNTNKIKKKKKETLQPSKIPQQYRGCQSFVVTKTGVYSNPASVSAIEVTEL